MWTHVSSVVRIYVGRFSAAVPIAVAVCAWVIAFVFAPRHLATDAVHDDYTDFFATGGQLIGTLLVALVLEAKLPLSRLGAVARGVTASGTVVIAVGGLAAALALGPGLSDGLSRALFATTWSGLATGFFAVALAGVLRVVAAFNEERHARLEDLAGKGDKNAARKLAERSGW